MVVTKCLYLLCCRSILAGWHHTVYFIKGTEKSSSHHSIIQTKLFFACSVSSLQLHSCLMIHNKSQREVSGQAPPCILSVIYHSASILIILFRACSQGPNSMSPNQDLQHLLATMRTTWLLSLLGHQYKCRESPSTLIHTSRFDSHTDTSNWRPQYIHHFWQLLDSPQNVRILSNP